MFNLFPKKKPFDEIVKAANLTPAWEWTPTQTPSMLQAQNDLIEQFLKENHDLKVENQKLKKEIQELKNDIHQPELCNEKIQKLELQNVALHKIIEGAQQTISDLRQEKTSYPIHWGGYTDETPWETAAADLALRVVKLEKKVEELTLIKVTSDPNYRYFLKNGAWPWDNKKEK
jgi:oligoribonuclease NrnB/cAMP/cGMP phosphodiesterase (DHH superfamily)